MTTVTMSRARAELPALVDKAHEDAVFLTKRGRTAAVLISPAAYERMLAALEDQEDIAAYDAAMSEEGPNIPWDEVKADLGLIGASGHPCATRSRCAPRH
ncbi:type II toxin-antitoxin system Phd/YefM family antitoxin [Actinomyces ruminis]|uniref:type II toxin-antitoxin system Phd/YefM family antitoxin n=1 Tax=Actinomyces ruminis TaxID=1937003 RepID=UPI0015D4EA48|nr:type II toxin-antitoxin system Phd/YefM family antitoxin [Actinomyces ruminis]